MMKGKNTDHYVIAPTNLPFLEMLVILCTYILRIISRLCAVIWHCAPTKVFMTS